VAGVLGRHGAPPLPSEGSRLAEPGTLTHKASSSVAGPHKSHCSAHAFEQRAYIEAWKGKGGRGGDRVKV
jgi:hypothetical protein